MLGLILVVIVLLLLGYASSWIKDRYWCKFGWHDWDLYAGFDQARVHGNAHCKRCGVKYDG